MVDYKEEGYLELCITKKSSDPCKECWTYLNEIGVQYGSTLLSKTTLINLCTTLNHLKILGINPQTTLAFQGY